MYVPKIFGAANLQIIIQFSNFSVSDHFEDNLAVTTALGIRSIGRHKRVAFAETSVFQLVLAYSTVQESLVDSLCSTY